MSLKKNINFESFIPDNMFQNFNSLNKKKIENLIEKTKENIKDNKSMFYSFSKDFKFSLQSCAHTSLPSLVKKKSSSNNS